MTHSIQSCKSLCCFKEVVPPVVLWGASEKQFYFPYFVQMYIDSKKVLCS